MSKPHTDTSSSPCVAPLRADPAYLSAGGYHFVAVNAGQIVGLGDGTYGQLGPSPDDIPATVAGLTGIKQVAAGGFSTIALKSDGTLVIVEREPDKSNALPQSSTPVDELLAQAEEAERKRLAEIEDAHAALNQPWSGDLGSVGVDFMPEPDPEIE